MRTRILLLAMAGIIGTFTGANAGTKLTPMLGLNYYTPSLTPLATGESVNAGTGINIGALVSFDVSPEMALELGLQNNGNSVTLKSSGGETSLSSRSWELPVQLRFMVSPSISLAGGGYYETFSDGTAESGGVSADFHWKKPSGMGLKIGGRYHAPIQPNTHFIVDLSFKVGLTDRTVTGSTLSYKDRAVTLGLGAEFDLSSSGNSTPSNKATPYRK